MINNGIAFVENESHDSGGSSDGEMEVEDANSVQVVTSDTTGPLLPRDTAAVGMFMHTCNIGYLLLITVTLFSMLLYYMHVTLLRT